MIKEIEHVALSVADLDRSLRFYCDIMGMKVLRIIESPPEKGLGDIVGIPGCSARIAHLLSGSFMFELLEYTDPKGRPITPDRTQADHGFIHVSFVSTDVAADVAWLREKGVEPLGRAVEYRPGVWVAYLKGPDGEVFELRQTPESSSQAQTNTGGSKGPSEKGADC
jgi:catechol 2,3-dioxygenase-like lactoylglutathione lyase family enzyme